MLDKVAKRVAIKRDAMRCQALADECGEIARSIGIAADRGGAGGFFEGAAQGRARPQFAGLDKDQGLARRRAQKTREQVGKPGRIGNKRRPVDSGDAERIGEVGADALREKLGPLAHKAPVGAVQQHRPQLRVGPAQKIGDAGRRDAHRPQPRCGMAAARRCRNRFSRVTISRARSPTMRVRASSSATMFAYWFAKMSKPSAECTVLTSSTRPLARSASEKVA